MIAVLSSVCLMVFGMFSHCSHFAFAQDSPTHDPLQCGMFENKRQNRKRNLSQIRLRYASLVNRMIKTFEPVLKPTLQSSAAQFIRKCGKVVKMEFKKRTSSEICNISLNLDDMVGDNSLQSSFDSVFTSCSTPLSSDLPETKQEAQSALSQAFIGRGLSLPGLDSAAFALPNAVDTRYGHQMAL